MARVFLNEYNKPFNPKGNQLWIFIGSTDAEAKTPILWPPDGKSQLIGKDPNAGKDWRQEEKGTTEDEMVGLNHQLNEFEQTPGDDEGQGILACCSPGGGKELDRTKQQQQSRSGEGSWACRNGVTIILSPWNPIWMRQETKAGGREWAVKSDGFWTGGRIDKLEDGSKVLRKWKRSRSVMSNSLQPHGL